MNEPPKMRPCKAIVVGATMAVLVSFAFGLSIVLLVLHEGSGD